MKKILFVLKRKEDFNAEVDSNIGLSTGLFNSASFVHQMLTDNNIESKLSVVIDNNCIDQVVNEYKPTHVIIEALWVVPEKFNELQKLHPTVKWIIRLHSEMPFLAGEGIAMDWIGEYSKFKNVIVACNSPRMFREIEFYLRHKNSWTAEQSNEKVIYLPNHYPQNFKQKKLDKSKDTINIGCFGAIRPLKNHLLQAFAAIEFADSIGKKLNFHINAGRIEMNGQPAINNIKSLFEQLYDKGHRLINHQWTPREKFLELCGTMDLGLQVSFSETFNIVGADIISQGVPLVSCKEVPWSLIGNCDPTNSKSIIKGLNWAYRFPQFNVRANQFSMKQYTAKVNTIWYNYFKD